MEPRMKHLIISRVNLHMDLDTWKYPIEKPYKQTGWNEDRIRLLNEYARPSLANQTNQNFTFISLWQKGTVTLDNRLPNELIIEIERTASYDDMPLDYKALSEGRSGKVSLNYAFQIREKIMSLKPAADLFTNLDCDDCLKYNFVEMVQDRIKEWHGDMDSEIEPPFGLDVVQRYCYNIATGKTGVKKRRTPSPFVTTFEPGGRVVIYPCTFNHTDIGRRIDVTKVPGLYALQTVNDTNMYSRDIGNECEVDLPEYGINLEG